MITLQELPKELQQYFKLIGKKWFIVIPPVYYISEGFDDLREAVRAFLGLEVGFEHSKEVEQLKMQTKYILQ